MQCPLCKGHMAEGTTILPYELDRGRIVVVLNVPALVCNQCGEDFIPIDVARVVEQIVKKAEMNGISMGFVTYDKAA